MPRLTESELRFTIEALLRGRALSQETCRILIREIEECSERSPEEDFNCFPKLNKAISKLLKKGSY